MTPAVQASVPPYGRLNQEAVQCIAQASTYYAVPELLLHAIVRKENGKLGQAVRSKNGSLDFGLAQINSSWLPDLRKFNIDEHALRDNACINLFVSAYILKTYHLRKGDWFKAIVAYNIGPSNWTPERYSVGYRYASTVVQYWREIQNWVDAYNPTAPSADPAVREKFKSRPSGPLQFSANP